MKILTILSFPIVLASVLFADSWKIENETDWKKQIKSSPGITIQGNLVSPTQKSGNFKTKVKRFKNKKR